MSHELTPPRGAADTDDDVPALTDTVAYSDIDAFEVGTISDLVGTADDATFTELQRRLAATRRQSGNKDTAGNDVEPFDLGTISDLVGTADDATFAELQRRLAATRRQSGNAAAGHDVEPFDIGTISELVGTADDATFAALQRRLAATRRKSGNAPARGRVVATTLTPRRASDESPGRSSREVSRDVSRGESPFEGTLSNYACDGAASPEPMADLLRVLSGHVVPAAATSAKNP